MNDAIGIVESIERQGVSLWPEGTRMRFRAAKGALTNEIKTTLSAQKEPILAAWRERAARHLVSSPATYAQRALWFLYKDKPESYAYNVALAIRIRSAVDVPLLQAACQALVDRHPSLRTTYAMGESDLAQQVHGDSKVSFQVHSRSGVDIPTLRDEVIAASQVPFRLETGPILRVDLFTRDVSDHVLLLAVHHIAIDGWSSVLLMEDLWNNYAAEKGLAAPIPRPEHDVPAYARWQEAMLASPEGQSHESYWMEALAGEIPVLDLPADHAPSSTETGGASCPVSLGAELSNAVRKLATTAGTTPFVVLLSAYQLLLHRYSGQSQVIVGTPTYGRDHSEFAAVIGDFINMIPLKADLSGDPTFAELLAQTRGRVLQGIQHQDYPFGLLVKRLQPERDHARTPIFQTAFMLQKFRLLAGLVGTSPDAASEAQFELGGLTLEPFPIPQQEGQLDVALELVDVAGTYQGHFKYNSGLYTAATVEGMSRHYGRLLQAAVASPTARTSQISFLSERERHQLLEEWNATVQDYPTNVCLHQLFESQVDRTPDAVAIVFEGQALTYRELDARANQLARFLQKRGIGAETLVGICLERSLEMVVGLLAILKAGGAYVPMDPSYPESRLAFMLEDACVKVLLTQKHLARSLTPTQAELICLDSDWSEIAGESCDRLGPCAQPHNLAYMIYTSGSTGQPKGAMNEHRAIVNRLLWMQSEYKLSSADSVLQKTPFSFDVSVWEFFWPLLAGARLVVAGPEGHKDPAYLVDLIARQQITILHFVPSALRMFLEARGLDACTSLRDVICSGEALPPELVRDFHARFAANLHNLYGPTEAAVDVTHWRCSRQDDLSIVPIGRPVANTRCYVLDSHLQPVPVGVPGQLHLGGIQVGRGYFNRPELTAEKFIPDPFAKQPTARLYRTGDLCRYLPDGNIQYLGRMDHQIKIRGFRIELGEIEAALNKTYLFLESIVTVREDVPGDQRLVAYLVTRDATFPPVEELRRELRAKLPGHMVPSAFVFLDRLPLSPNGKVDRKALPEPDHVEVRAVHDYVAPRTETETIVAEVIGEVLGLERVGANENFFELGGHSLLATRVVARLCDRLGIEVPMRWLFEAPTASKLGEYLDTVQWAGRDSEKAVVVGEERECLEI